MSRSYACSVSRPAKSGRGLRERMRLTAMAACLMPLAIVACADMEDPDNSINKGLDSIFSEETPAVQQGWNPLSWAVKPV